jgi:hypothetical protein
VVQSHPGQIVCKIKKKKLFTKKKELVEWEWLKV